MRLDDLLSRHPGVRRAGPADNERLLAFFESAPMRTTGFDVRYVRRPDFFRLLRYQGDRAHVVIGEEPDGTLAGVGTLSLRPGWVRGRPTTVGYLGDLRVRPGRVRSALWRRVFADLLAHAHEIDELADCEHWTTAILDENRPARRALEGKGKRGPRLVPLAGFRMRNLVARRPLARRARSSGWRVFRATPGDAPALTAFLDEVDRSRPLGFRESLDDRLSRWEGLGIGDFVCAADATGMVACGALWSSSAAKQTLVSRVPPGLRALGALAALVPGRPVRVPRAGEPLRAPTLTHLAFAARLDDAERVEVCRALLMRVFERRREEGWHCVSLCDFDAWGLGRGLGDFVQHAVPITLYSVIPPRHGAEAAEALAALGPPAFEMALV